MMTRVPYTSNPVCVGGTFELSYVEGLNSYRISHSFFRQPVYELQFRYSFSRTKVEDKNRVVPDILG